MEAFELKCISGENSCTEVEVYSEDLGKEVGYVRGLGCVVIPPTSLSSTTISTDLAHYL